MDPKGTAKTLAELDGIAIQAIAIDAMDRVYAATSPDGKVYRVYAAGQVEVFYDPKAKYIWAMAFDKAGESVRRYRRSRGNPPGDPGGSGIGIFQNRGDACAVAGGGRGRQSDRGHGPQRTDTADVSHGSIGGTRIRVVPGSQARDYGAGGGRGWDDLRGGGRQQAGRRSRACRSGGAPPAVSVVTTTAAANAAAAAAARPAGLPPPAIPAVPAVAGGSEIYRIQTDGYARKVFSDATDLVYSLAFDSRGRAIAGTGNRGYLYRIDSDHSFTRLRSLTSMQVTGLVSAPDGTLYAVTGNIGKLFSVGPGMETSGTYESEVLDAGAFSYWGRITSEPAQGGVSFETRSGNLDRPQQNWSPWEKLNSGRIASPAARFLEYKATLMGSAEIAEVETAYQMKNVAPVIQEVEITRETTSSRRLRLLRSQAIH